MTVSNLHYDKPICYRWGMANQPVNMNSNVEYDDEYDQQEFQLTLLLCSSFNPASVLFILGFPFAFFNNGDLLFCCTSMLPLIFFIGVSCSFHAFLLLLLWNQFIFQKQFPVWLDPAQYECSQYHPCVKFQGLQSSSDPGSLKVCCVKQRLPVCK